MYYKINTLSFCSNFLPGINAFSETNFSRSGPQNKSLGEKWPMTSKMLRNIGLDQDNKWRCNSSVNHKTFTGNLIEVL